MKSHWKFWFFCSLIVFVGVYLYKKKQEIEPQPTLDFYPTLNLPHPSLADSFRGNPLGLLQSTPHKTVLGLNQKLEPLKEPKDIDLFLGLARNKLTSWIQKLPLDHRIIPGEDFFYSILWNGLEVGQAHVWTTRDPQDKSSIKISCRVRSNGLVEKIYPVNNLFESKVKSRTGLTTEYYKNQNEGGRQRIDKINVDPLRLKAHYQKIKKGRLSRSVTYDVPPQITDPLGGFFYLRNLECEVGENLTLDILNNKRLSSITLKRTPDLTIEVPLGKFECITYIPDLIKDKFFDQTPEGEAKIYLERNVLIAVKIEVVLPSPIGKISMLLNRWKRSDNI